MPQRTLIIGWFSFQWMGATAGDYIAADMARTWLGERRIESDLAVYKPTRSFEVTTDSINPADYDTVIFVCGPIGDGPPLNEFLDRFPHARKFALNVSLLQERSEWNPFVHIVERDSKERTNPDITFAAPDARVPVVGVIYVGHQKEYKKVRHDVVEQCVSGILQKRDIAAFEIDTQLDPENRFGLRTPSQIESMIAKMDAVITTRLHGAAIALRRHVPPVVIDSVTGGTKLLRQMKRIEWPLTFEVGNLDPVKIAEALDFALTPEARKLAAKCAAYARQEVEQVRREFIESLSLNATTNR